MTAPETGREIPADELATGLRSDAASINSLRRKTPRDVEDAVRYTAAADLIEAQAARIASLEAERARTVELPTWKSMDTAPLNGKHCILAVEHGCFIYSVQGAFDGRQWRHVLDTDAQPLAWMPNILLPDELRPKRFRSDRALASEKGGQADG